VCVCVCVCVCVSKTFSIPKLFVLKKPGSRVKLFTNTDTFINTLFYVICIVGGKDMTKILNTK
jgi:hypothetical protein